VASDLGTIDVDTVADTPQLLQDTGALVSMTASITPSLYAPNAMLPLIFERHSNQLPSPPFGESVPHINDANIESIYEEARLCTSHQAFTSAVMLCRKLLMNIAVKHGAPENQSFQSYVEYLDENGFVPPNGKKWVDAIRQKGNEANHEISLMTARDAHNIVRFSEMLLRFVYEMPNMFEGEPG